MEDNFCLQWTRAPPRARRDCACNCSTTTTTTLTTRRRTSSASGYERANGWGSFTMASYRPWRRARSSGRTSGGTPPRTMSNGGTSSTAMKSCQLPRSTTTTTSKPSRWTRTDTTCRGRGLINAPTTNARFHRTRCTWIFTASR